MNLVQMYLVNISGVVYLSIMRLNYRRKRNQRDLCCFFEVIITVSIKVSSNDNSSTSLFVEGFNLTGYPICGFPTRKFIGVFCTLKERTVLILYGFKDVKR